MVADKCLKQTHIGYYDNIIKNLLCGYFMNIAVKGFKDKYWIIKVNQKLGNGNLAIEYVDKAMVATNSVFNKNTKRNWIVFNEIVVQQCTIVQCVTAVKPQWLLTSAPDYFDMKGLHGDLSYVSAVLRKYQN